MNKRLEQIARKSAEGRLSSIQIAKTFGRRNDQVTKLIDQYREKFESFGAIQREKAKTGGRPTIEYFLNESQFIYLITLFSNAGEVPENKRKLVQEFMKLSKKTSSPSLKCTGKAK